VSTHIDAHGEHPLDAEWFAVRLERAERVVVDVGAGDGRYAYELARADPSALVVAFDPAAENFHDTAAKAARRRTRADNLVLLRASVEDLPYPLVGRGDEVHVILPWGHLFEGLIETRSEVLDGLAALVGHNGELWIVLNAGAWDSVPNRLAQLPRPTADLVDARLGPAFTDRGFSVEAAYPLSDAECRAIPSGWARRLAHRGRVPNFVALRARRR